jgi:hypothetical protein
MLRIDDSTVELTADEERAHDQFDRLLDQGLGIPAAAEGALNQYIARTASMPSAEFIEYLSDDTCERSGNAVRVRPNWEQRLEAKRGS